MAFEDEGKHFTYFKLSRKGDLHLHQAHICSQIYLKLLLLIFLLLSFLRRRDRLINLLVGLAWFFVPSPHVMCKNGHCAGVFSCSQTPECYQTISWWGWYTPRRSGLRNPMEWLLQVGSPLFKGRWSSFLIGSQEDGRCDCLGWATQDKNIWKVGHEIWSTHDWILCLLTSIRALGRAVATLIQTWDMERRHYSFATLIPHAMFPLHPPVLYKQNASSQMFLIPSWSDPFHFRCPNKFLLLFWPGLVHSSLGKFNTSLFTL